MNGVGYLDVGTAPATVISRFNDFLRGFASLSHSLSHLLGTSLFMNQSWHPRFYFRNQCRKEADPTYNDSEFESSIDFESIWEFKIQFQCRSMSDPPLSDIDF